LELEYLFENNGLLKGCVSKALVSNRYNTKQNQKGCAKSQPFLLSGNIFSALHKKYLTAFAGCDEV